MIRDITLGQFYPGNSWIHRLDPRVKIMVTLLYIVSIFVVKDFIGFALAALGLAVVIAISRVPLKFILRGLKPIFILIAFTFIINMFMIKGEVLVSFWIFSISTRRAADGRIYGDPADSTDHRLVAVDSDDQAYKPDGRNRKHCCHPFKRFGLPAHDLAMMMTIALRFIPTLLEETDKIMKAQMARGARILRAVISLRQSESTDPDPGAAVYQCIPDSTGSGHGYGSQMLRQQQQKTRMNGMKICSRDIAACLIFAAFLAMIILERILL